MKSVYRGVFRSFAVLVAIWVGGCAAVPVEEFNAYRQATIEAKSASEEVLAVFAVNAGYLQGVAEPPVEEDGLVVARVEPVPPAAKATLKDHITARTLVFTSLVELNDAMAFLAEGKSAEQLSASFDNFGTAVTTLANTAGRTVPGLGEFISLGQTLFVEAEKARNREQLLALFRKQGDVEGSGRKVIGEALSWLRQDAASYRDGARAAAILRIDEIGDELLITHVGAMRALADSLDGSAGGGPVNRANSYIDRAKLAMVEVNHQAHALRARKPSTRLLSEEDDEVEEVFENAMTGATAIDEIAASQLLQFALSIEAERDKTRLIRDNYVLQLNAINAYDDLLAGLELSLTLLADASNRPVNPMELANELTALAILVRGRIDAFETARKK